MGIPSFTDLTTIPVQDDVLNQEVLPELRTRGLKVDDWFVGGVYRAMSYVVALLRLKDRIGLAALTAAQFEDYAFGFTTAPGGIDVTGWAPLLAKQRYGVIQIAATYTQRLITLTNSSSTPYGPLQAGDIMLQFTASGNRYVLNQTLTIPASSSIQAVFRSEFVTNTAAKISYTDPTNSTIAFVTSSFPGVVATNPSTIFSAVSQSGSGVGLVTATGTPSGTHTVAVRITATGSVGNNTVGWQTNLDNGGWTDRTGTSTVTLGSGIIVTLSDNSGTPAFVLGSVYYFTSPGSDITQQGVDIESPQALGTRVRGLWPSLSYPQDGNGNWIPTSPTISGYEALTRSSNSQVKVVLVQTDGTIDNQVNIIIAGQGGAALSTAVVANVQSFFDSLSMITDLPAVHGTIPTAIVLGGLTLTVKASQLFAAQLSLQNALARYLGGVDPNNQINVNPTIDHAYITSIARTTIGISKISDNTLTINGVVGDLQMPTVSGQFQSALWSQEVATAFTWITTP